MTHGTPSAAEFGTWRLRYRVTPFFLPFVEDVESGTPGTEGHRLIKGIARRIAERGTDEALAVDTLNRDGSTVVDTVEAAEMYDGDYFERYAPSGLIANDPVKTLDFDPHSPAAAYMREFFVDVPIAIASQLLAERRFDDALRWASYVFDPTANGSGPAPQRYWGVRPLQMTEAEQTEAIFRSLADRNSPAPEAIIRSIEEWADNPFNPFAVARHRPTAYMYQAIFLYLDILLAKGDHWYRIDTAESLVIATQCYGEMLRVLGPPPSPVPHQGDIPPQTYASLRGASGELGAVLVDLETSLQFDNIDVTTSISGAHTSDSLTQVLYFCVPPNEKLLGYWKTVALRLFNIRNSLDINGVFRRLALFSSGLPADWLVDGTAAGVDIPSEYLNTGQPLPPLRFQFLIAKAKELANEVRSLGAGLLGAIEKEDAEALQILRSGHERTILELSGAVRYGQWQEARKSREAVERSLAGAAERYSFYEKLLGRDPADIEIPTVESLDETALLDGKLRTREPRLPIRDVPIDNASESVLSGLGVGGGIHLAAGEALALAQRATAEAKYNVADQATKSAAALVLLPKVATKLAYWGVGIDLDLPTGETGAGYLERLAQMVRASGDRYQRYAARTDALANYFTREQDRTQLSNAAAAEYNQLAVQLRGAQIREVIAKREYEVHQRQLAQANEVESFLTDPRRGKTTNKDFYAWYRKETRALLGNGFDLAYDAGLLAQTAMQRELGEPELRFMSYENPGGHEGLLAGEKLSLALSRMEMEYHDRNRREYELTKDIDLVQLDPEALVRLRATGSCEFRITEEALDTHGLYFCRLKLVEVNIRTVKAPTTGIHATLTLTRSSIRTNPDVSAGYGRNSNGDDPRFVDYVGTTESIVTSTGINDSGLFETTLRDERYLPFEGHGAISRWKLSLPADPSAEGEFPAFDYSNIQVVLRIRYTARDGGDDLQSAAKNWLADAVADGTARGVGTVRLFDVRREFPDAWARFKASDPNETGLHVLELDLRREHYPFWAADFLEPTQPVGSVNILAGGVDALTVYDEVDGTGPTDELQKTNLGRILSGVVSNTRMPMGVGTYPLVLDTNRIDELILIIAWMG